MKISVITPFKNSAKWIKRCMESMYENDGDFEFIFIDDHSEDFGKQIASAYALRDDRFVIMENLHSPGVGGARNTGLDAATGDYVIFVDADDELIPNAYHILTKELDTIANIHQFNHQRQYWKTGKIVTKYKNPAGWYEVPNLPTFWFLIWNKAFRREFLKDLYFDEDMNFGEDEIFNLKCLAKDKFIHCSDDPITIHHFDNKNSLSKIKKKEDLLKEFTRLQSFIENYYEDPKLIRLVCIVLSDRWGTGSYIKELGGDIDGL